jgi:hypothetical protein
MDAVELNIVDVLNSKARRPFETTVHHALRRHKEGGDESIGAL